MKIPHATLRGYAKDAYRSVMTRGVPTKQVFSYQGRIVQVHLNLTKGTACVVYGVPGAFVGTDFKIAASWIGG